MSVSSSSSTESMGEQLVADHQDNNHRHHHYDNYNNNKRGSSLQPLERLNVNGFLKMVGEFGRYQILLTIVFCLMFIPFTSHVLIMFFAAQQSDWICVSNSTQCTLNGTFTSENDLRCHIPRSEWEYIQPKGISIVTDFDIYCENDWIISMSSSIVFIGWIVGAIILGWIADSYGRKKVLFGSFFMMLTCGMIGPFVNNIHVFLLMRFLVGFFIPGTSYVMFVLISELVGDAYRATANNVLWASCTLSLCLLGLTAYFVRQWKTLFLVCTAPYFILLLAYKFVPESVRWLRLKGKLDEALEIFETMAKFNGRKFNINATMRPVSGKSKSSPLELFKTKRMAIRTSLQGFVWMVNGAVYFGISLAANDLGGSLYFNYVLVSIVELPAAVMAIWLCNRYGRRCTAYVSVTLAGLMTLLVAFVSSPNEARIALGMIGKFMIMISFNSIGTLSVELHPTDIRSEALGILQIASRVGAASAPWIVQAARVNHHGLPFIIMGVLGLMAGVATFFLPETNRKETRETENDITEEVLFMDEIK